MASTGPVPASAPAPLLAPAPAPALSSQDSIDGRRGSWLTDWSRGRIALLDRGPVPRQSILLPIPMYHHVRPIDFKTSSAFEGDLTLPPAEFERQLRYLKEKGFSSASMADLELYFQGRRDLPSRSIIFTFDDGYRDNYTYAFPLLLRYGFTATFFIATGFTGQGDYMTEWQLREMAARGMEIGAHTVDHVDLARVSPSWRERELVEPKRTLEQLLGVSVRALSYPSGSYSKEAMSAARAAGYVTAVTTQHGATHDREKLMELSRIRIHGTDTLPVFRWRIEQYFPLAGPTTS